MTAKNVKRRQRRWTRRSERAIRYGLLARWSDWLCATRDAKKGLPELPPKTQPPGQPAGESPTLGTPRLSSLGQLGLGRIEKEWIVYQAEVADAQAELRDATARRDATAKQRAEAKTRLEGMQEPDLDAKVAGEDRTDLGIVRARRGAAYAARQADEAAKVNRLTAEFEAVEARMATLDEQIGVRLRIAERRAALIEAHSRRRCAGYLTRLVRKHPEGKRLNRLLRPDWPPPPDWARANRPPVPQAAPATPPDPATPDRPSAPEATAAAALHPAGG